MDKVAHFVESKLEGHGNASKTGGEELNTGQHSSGGYGAPDIDHQQVIQNAQQHGSGDSSLFETAMGFLNSNQSHHSQPIDETHVTESHKKVYDNNEAGNVSADSLGGAAALQILKQFTSGGKSSSGGGNSQTQMISMAMAEASKMFDKSGGTASGNKQDAVNSAGMTIMKLLVQSKMGGGGTIGGSNSGGLGQLMSLAKSL